MSTYGSVISCPTCGAEHIIQIGETVNERRITFACTIYAADFVLDNEIREPSVPKRSGVMRVAMKL